MSEAFEEKRSRRRREHVSAPEHALRIVKALWKNKWWILLLMVAAFAVFSWCSAKASQKKASATLVLLYEQAYEGLNPNGTRFNIYELLSDDVLDKTIERAGLTGELEKEDLVESLAISASGSQDARDMYIATEYTVTLNAGKLPRHIGAESMLTLLMETYREYFLDHYGTDDSALDIDWSNAHSLEYLEFASYMDIKAGNLINYLNGLRTESGMSQYRISGESFRSLSDSVASFRDIYLNRFTSYVTVNHLFRDPAGYRSMLLYQRFLNEQDMKKNQDLYDIYQDALNMYDESMITFVMVPMYDTDSGLYMARTAIGMDSLTESSESYVDALDISARQMKDLDRKIEATRRAGNAQEKHAAAEQMIDEIQEHMDDLIVRIRTVKKDYDDYRSKNSIRFVMNHPGPSTVYNVKGAAAAALGVLALFVVVFAVRTRSRREDVS